MSKTLMAIVVLAVVVILGFWLMGPSAEAPSDTASEADTTAMISQELDSVNLGDLDKEMQDVTAELNNL
ncbi:MAG: hypothetical protein G01um10143_628 [Parcubacteria group bacterium Gr01-1014_3]|nr:MAG: hypothetical protein G01um10143_628 [Parcubacteria group bacterium Gr01-1014_3]